MAMLWESQMRVPLLVVVTAHFAQARGRLCLDFLSAPHACSFFLWVKKLSSSRDRPFAHLLQNFHRFRCCADSRNFQYIYPQATDYFLVGLLIAFVYIYPGTCICTRRAYSGLASIFLSDTFTHSRWTAHSSKVVSSCLCVYTSENH
jgi:hypothetical protein